MEKFKVGEFKKRKFKREKGNPYSLTELPDKKTLEDFLKGIFYTSDTVYNSSKGRFERSKK